MRSEFLGITQVHLNQRERTAGQREVRFLVFPRHVLSDDLRALQQAAVRVGKAVQLNAGANSITLDLGSATPLQKRDGLWDLLPATRQFPSLNFGVIYCIRVTSLTSPAGSYNIACSKLIRTAWMSI